MFFAHDVAIDLATVTFGSFNRDSSSASSAKNEREARIFPPLLLINRHWSFAKPIEKDYNGDSNNG